MYTGREAYIDCPIIDIQDFSVLSFESFRIMDFSKRFIVKRSDGRVLFIENENDKLNLKNLGVEIDAVNKLGDLGFKVECHDPIPNEAIVLKEKETAIIEAEYIN